MRSFTTYFDDMPFPVIRFRRKERYNDKQPTGIFDSAYTILHEYEQIDVVVPDEGKSITQEQIKAAADAGTPVKMCFHDLEITIRPKSQWEIQASGRASQAAVASTNSK